MYPYIKRFTDTAVSLLSIVLLSPIFLLIALWVKLDSKGPVLFSQARYGKGRKVFYMYKFRSMYTAAPKHMPPNKFKDASSYITKAGNILRKTSLDELPQLFNILKGDMSLVGPRPGSAQNEEELAAERDKTGAFSVLPGITGWAQVNGRDELAHDIKEKAYMDGLYAKNFGAKMDLLCIMRTVETVLLMKGYQEGSAEDIVASERRKLNAVSSKAKQGGRKISVIGRIVRRAGSSKKPIIKKSV